MFLYLKCSKCKKLQLFLCKSHQIYFLHRIKPSNGDRVIDSWMFLSASLTLFCTECTQGSSISRPNGAVFGFGWSTNRQGIPVYILHKVKWGWQKTLKRLIDLLPFVQPCEESKFDKTCIEKVLNFLHFEHFRLRNKVLQSIVWWSRNIFTYISTNLELGCQIVSKDKTVYWILYCWI